MISHKTEKRGPQKIKVGKIVGAVGIKGEVKIYHYSDYKERFAEHERLILAGGYMTPRGACEFKVQNIRYQKDLVIAKLEGIEDRNFAEKLNGVEVYITTADLKPLPDDTYYVRDLIGCRVVDINNGSIVGAVGDVIKGSAQDLYVVNLTGGGQAMIPAVGEFIKAVDIRAREIRIRPIPGLLPDTQRLSGGSR